MQQQIPYQFMYQPEPRKRGGMKGRFKKSESSKKFWAKNKDNYSDKENARPTKNEVMGLRSNVRLINKLNTIHETIDSKPYVMPVYRNGFIGVESFIPRNSNRQKYRVLIPDEVSKKWGYRGKYSRHIKERDKIFDSKYSAEKHARTLEQEHIEYVKQQYEEYFKTNKYT